MWSTRRVFYDDYREQLTTEKHISHDLNIFKEIYDLTGEQSEKRRVVEHTINQWQDERSLRNEEGNPLNILLWEKGDQLVWEPVIEHSLHLKFFEENGKNNYSFGYIADGKPFPYTMWQQTSKKVLAEQYT